MPNAPYQITPITSNFPTTKLATSSLKTMKRKVLFSAVKNEGPTLLEWIAYHQLIGFDTIYIASNDCTDGTDKLLDALQDAGVIDRHLPHKPDLRFGPQRSAIMTLNKSNLLQNGDWFAFLDADEYLNIHLGNGYLDDLIDKIGTRAGMSIPWRLFGDGNTHGIIQRQISEEFKFAEAQPSGRPCQVKSIFRYALGELELAYGNMHRPQIMKAGIFTLEDFLLAGNVEWEKDREINQKWMQGRKSAGTAYISPQEFSTDFAQINHYSVRNRDMFKMKKLRGRGFYRKKDADASARIRHNEEFYRTHNCNDVVDRSILRHKSELDKIIASYLTIPAIAHSHAEIINLTEKALDNVNRDVHSISTIQSESPENDVFLPQITLPPQEAQLMKEHYQSAQTILEYGSGGSTIYAASLPHKPKIFSIESDQNWAAKLQSSLTSTYPEADIHLRHIDIGKTKAWGHPADHKSYLKYPDYPFSIYDDPDFESPDVILIDGRFRQACFYAALFKSSKPITILWDDYANRKEYHSIERYFEPVEIIGRMAKFEVSPLPFPVQDIAQIIKEIMNSK